MTTDNNDLAAQVAALQATVADMAEQLKHLFRLHGPATWAHIQKQRRDNLPKPPLPTNKAQEFGEVYRPKDHEK
jgi:hypothetical protein